ncbi:unnamed protein product [Caenorhabditis brenneri]
MAPPISNRWTTHPEYIELLNYVIERTKDVKSPMNILPLAKEFKEKRGAEQTASWFETRIYELRTRIHTFARVDTNTKVKLLFALSASVDANFLEIMKKDAFVELDNKKRITHYKSNDGILDLRGDHSRSAKVKTAQLESKGSLRSMISGYFENKNDANAIPQNEKEKEMRSLIEFITENCVDVDIPLSIIQLAKDFKNRFGISVPLKTICTRIKGYCREIQKIEFLDTRTKVQQLFVLSATLNSDCLKELRKDAVVEVDKLNRITKYTAHSGRLNLHGDHSYSAKRKLDWIERRKIKQKVKKDSNSGGDENEEIDKEIDHSEDDSDEYSGEGFGNEFDSDDQNDPLDEPDHMDSSNEILGFDDETPIRNRSSTEMSIDVNFDFDPPTERSYRSEETERRADEENDLETTGNVSVNKKYGRLSKRRHMDSEFSYNQENSSSSEVSMNTDSLLPKSAKQKKGAIQKEQASRSFNQIRSSPRSMRRSNRNSSFPPISTDSEDDMEHQNIPSSEGNTMEYNGPRIEEIEDYDYNPREDNLESSRIDNKLEEPKPQATEEHNKSNEVQNTDKRSDTVAPEPKPEKESLTLQNNQNSAPQMNGNEFISIESHVRFLESLIPMIKTFETPTLEEDELRIEKND